MVSREDVREVLRSLDLEKVMSGKPGALPKSDSDLSLHLWEGEHCLGIAGISLGLKEYYGSDYMLPEECTRAIEHAHGRWIFTQMQASKNTLEQRKKVNFRRELLRSWDWVASAVGIRIEYFLPAELNYWVMPEVRFGLADLYFPLPKRSVLLMNYDYTARNNGFRYDTDSRLYKR